MNFRKIRTILLVVIIVFAFLYNAFFPKFLVAGEYVADIYDEFATFGVSNGERLILNKDGTFQCDAWGTGTYEIKGSKIEFHTDDMGIHTHFYRPYFFGKPRIVLFGDLNSEFIKQ